MFKVIGSYNGGSFEELAIAINEREAKYLVTEYRMAYGNEWRIIYYRID